MCLLLCFVLYIYIHDSHSVWRFQTSIGLVVILFGIATIKRERQKQKENIKIGAAIYEANAQAKQIFFGKTRKKYQHINDHNLWSYFFCCCCCCCSRTQLRVAILLLTLCLFFKGSQAAGLDRLLWPAIPRLTHPYCRGDGVAILPSAVHAQRSFR